MSKPVVPHHAPEVIAAGAAKRWQGDDEKVATTSLKSLNVHGCTLTSRYDKAHEFERMSVMVEHVEPELRHFLISIWCDSQATSCYAATLRPCSQEVAAAIARQLEHGAATPEGGEGHNGIYLSGHGSGTVDRDASWSTDEWDES